jgi:hypothetical protein
MSENLRYIPGQIYTFSRTIFSPGESNYFSDVYFPWSDELKEIQVRNFLCKEHHKVSWDQEPKGEKKYDGFIFEAVDDPSQVWVNQYPSACYSQTSNENDFVLFLHFENEEIFEVDENDKTVYDKNNKLIIKNQENFDAYVDAFYHRWTLAIHTLSKIVRGVRWLKDENEVKKYKLLQMYLTIYTQKIEEVSGKKVKFGPAGIKDSEGTIKYIDSFWEAEFEEN